MASLWKSLPGLFFITIMTTAIVGCASNPPGQSSAPALADSHVSPNLPLYQGQAPYSTAFNEEKYRQKLPPRINTHDEKMVVVDPKQFAWGAYDADGDLIRAGIATAGADYCPDTKRPCHTTTGTFRIYAMRGEECISKTYPVGKGGSLMPYCMFFHNGESLHGTPDQMMNEANISHGCIHMRIPDAAWLQQNFADVGTKVVILPYS